MSDEVIEKRKGRPPKEINEEEVLKLASIGCTYEEMAAWFKVDKQTLLNRFSDVIKEGHTNVKMSIRRKQLRTALEDGNVTMLIWLGKQMLDQKEPPREEVIVERKEPVPVLVEKKILKGASADEGRTIRH